MSLQLSVFILCLSFFLVAVAAIPFLLQMWRTIKTLETTLQTLNRTLPGLLENLEAITLSLRHATHTVDVEIEKLALAADRVSLGLGLLWNLKNALYLSARIPLVRKIRAIRAFGRGVRTFFNALQVERAKPSPEAARLSEAGARSRSGGGTEPGRRNG
mgnify:CR=1 FL=1|jgi:hypothetical protein